MKKYIALKNKNKLIRDNSSSGGFFYSLSEYIISNGGVVYGAVYDDNNNVVHQRIAELKSIKKMCGSKYSLSYIGKCFSQVKEDLINNKIVLFSSTPCQIYALKTYLNNRIPDNLILIDLICHGAPQKKYFNDYKEFMEQKYKSKISSINMRYKIKEKYIVSPIDTKYMKIKFKNGKKYLMSSEFDIYYRLFDYFLLSSCYKCKFAKSERISDITIGDYHDFKFCLKDFNDGNGVSLIILNTKKGLNIFNKIKNNYDYFETVFENCKQPALLRPTSKPNGYEEFNLWYNKEGFKYIVKKFGGFSVKDYIRYVLYKMNLLNKLIYLKKKLTNK